MSISLAKKISGFLGAICCGAVLALAPTTAASAHPIITWMDCDSGSSTIVCFMDYTGAHEPAAIQWFVNGTLRSAWDGQKSVMTSCTLNNTYIIQVKVTDIHGFASQTVDVLCRRVWE